MAFKTFCDICDKEVKGREYFVRAYGEMKHFCNSCWVDKKNWSRIHKVEKEEL